MRKTLLFLILFSLCISAQSKDPDKILDDVKNNFSKVENYVVDVHIKLNVSFLKVPDTNAKIYFKQPDKTQVEARGFALLPRGAMNISPAGLLKGKYTAFYDREETYNGIKTDVIKTIPLGETEDVILSTFWIDTARKRIVKVEISTKLNGTFTLELKYSNSMKFPLPSSMIFSFDVSKLNIPKRFSGNTGNDDKQSGDNKENARADTGRVFIDYSNYVINKGVPDSVFTKPENNLRRRK